MEENSQPRSPAHSESYQVLVTGITGTGKSPLIRAIAGQQSVIVSTEESPLISRVNTEKVSSTDCILGGCSVTFWDTPGLCGGSKNRKRFFEQVPMKCSQPSLILHCVNVTNARFVFNDDDNPTFASIKDLTVYFGVSFWNNAIIALTFADKIEQQKPRWRKYTAEKKKQSLKGELRKWEEILKKSLNSLHVPQEIIKTVAFVAVGDSTEDSCILGDWLDNLKTTCISKLLNQPTTGQTQMSRLRRRPIANRRIFLGGLIGGGIGLILLPMILVTVPCGVTVGVAVAVVHSNRKILKSFTH